MAQDLPTTLGAGSNSSNNLGNPTNVPPPPLGTPNTQPLTNSIVPSPPSLDSTSTLAPSMATQNRNNNITLPRESGQYWEEYDLRPYTQQIKGTEQPQQAIIDWILRETGTDIWFSQPTGVLSADRTTLRVYQTEAMHKVVRQVYERFVNASTESQVYGMRLVTINNPNWRTRATGWMKSVQVQSPGVHAWLLSKENYAMLMAMLRGRSDFHEVQVTDIPLQNGQTQSLEQLRSRNYVREYQRTEQGWPPYVPTTADIQEGYRLQFSPLLSTDQRTLDVVLKCSIDQVERLNSVNIDLPLATGQVQSAQIQVPQVVSWRLHERFRWPADQVLLLSCGVVAAPAGNVNNTLLGQGANALGLNRIVPPLATGDRADALLILEYKGGASTQVATPQNLNNANNPSVSRGRY